MELVSQSEPGNFPLFVAIFSSVAKQVHVGELKLNTCAFQLRDGTTGAQLGKFCGSSLPSAVTASGRTIVVQMSTDSSVSAGGFSAAWSGRLLNQKKILLDVLKNKNEPSGECQQHSYIMHFWTGRSRITQKKL